MPTLRIVVAVVVAMLIALAALCVGQFPLSIREIAEVVTGGGSAEARTVLFELRLPRVLGAFLVGAALAASGAAYQNLFRNPLVSPDILGVTSGAALGAVIAMLLSVSFVWVQASAFAGGLAAVALITALGTRLRGHEVTLTLVLIGVVVASLFGAAVALVKTWADPLQQLPAMTYWLTGSFAHVTRADLLPAAVLIVLALIPLVLLRWRMNVLSLADDEARALGLDVARMRLIVVVSATLMTATSVALCGVIGWVGLVVPHAVRAFAGAEFSRLLPLCVIGGGAFMVVIDTLARSVTATELPPGVLTAFIGSPVFVWLLARSAKAGAA